ncbi:hypothetical protein [Rickettsiella endosymbiont of Miltochrista miniata]|uniref:hypothetical protein n=1 Tax=Rickettsiella endosymbiont of Miltochrista miniata TaxID=3066239 RepID=UPI00313EC3E6
MPNDRKAEEHPIAPKENSNIVYWLFTNMAMGIGLASVLLYFLVRNQSNSGLNSVKSGKSSGIANQAAFFPSPALPCVNEECVEFAYHQSFRGNKFRVVVNKNLATLKKIVASLPLTLANRAALAKATIRLVPVSPLRSGASGFIEGLGQIFIVMNEYLDEQDLRGTLLNEIHHLTVMEINKHKLGNNWDDFSSGQVAGLPFMTKDGKISTKLKTQLEKSLLQIKNKMSEFDSLLNNQEQLSGEAKKKLATYLAAMDDYVPTVYNRILDINLFKHVDRHQHSIEIKMTLDTDQEVYGKPVFNYKKDEVLVWYSLNRDRSPLELAKAFIYDFKQREERSNTIYTSAYAREERAESLSDYLLTEAASDMDELLTPKLKKVFAPLFMDYFDRYADPYLQSIFIPSLSRMAQR